MVQKDADVLWWSREPKIHNTNDHLGQAVKNMKRIRRWVNKHTAIGLRKLGGLGNIDWKTHVNTSFQGQWIIRYLNPSNSSWKKILDSYILYQNGQLKYPEGRAIVMCNLSNKEKKDMLQKIPKSSNYIRTCLKEFWRFDLKPHFPHDKPLLNVEKVRSQAKAALMCETQGCQLHPETGETENRKRRKEVRHGRVQGGERDRVGEDT